MQYDPIKKSLGELFNKSPFLRKTFYSLLDLLLLRTWHVKDEFRKWAKNHQNTDAKILDAGSGFGQYSYFMSGMNKRWTVKGVDVKTEQIADCNAFFKQINRNNATFAEADLVKFSEPNQYDFILSVDVMEHILEDVAVFKNFYQSMKKGGTLLISTPSDQGGSDAHDHEHDHDAHDSFIDEHVRDGYNIQEIQDKLKLAGFSKTSARYTYGIPGKISWKISMKYPILLLNVSKIFFVIIPFYYLITFPFALILNYLDLKNHHKTGTGLNVVAIK
jgi:SAM-dependent methyltransferase